MSNHDDQVFERFIEEGIISSVDGVLKSGKEATVFRCTPGPCATAASVAVKVYKDIGERSFRNMTGYLDGRIGRTVRKRRDILHMMNDEASMQAYWIEAEFEALSRLTERGLPVPRPFLRTGRAMAMELIEEDGEVAAQLVHAGLPKDALPDLYAALVDSIIEMLRLDLIHGDLSPYNILVRDGRLVIIDFPQAIDARYHSQGEAMFARDLENVSRWFEKAGVAAAGSHAEVAREAWALYEMNRL
jgi:RIO kinase 1